MNTLKGIKRGLGESIILQVEFVAPFLFYENVVDSVKECSSAEVSVQLRVTQVQN